MSSSSWFAFAALSSILACGTASAQQSTEDQAREQFDTGVELFEKGQFAQASVAFARAYELRPSYKILYLVGKCESELGHFAASLDAFTRYLAEGGDKIEKSRRDEVRTEISKLNVRVGSIAVEAGAGDLTVFVDGRRSGTTPLPGPVFVDLGEHEVRLARGSGDVYREVVKVAGGQRVTVKIDAGGAATATSAPAPEEAGAAAPGEGAGAATATGAADRAGPKRVWTWIAFGVGGAAAVGAAVTGGLVLSKAGDVKDQCDGNDCPTSVEDEADTARALGNATTALIAVAGVGIVAGIVFYFVEPRWSGEKAIAVAPVAAPVDGGAALGLAGRF